MGKLGRDFRIHLTGVGLANLADGILSVAVPLIAITLTRSPLLMGVLTAAIWVPWLLAGIPAGVLVDRWDRNRTRVVALSLRAALLAGVAVAVVTGHLTIWLLVVAAMLYGLTEVFTDLAAASMVPTLVGREASSLHRANSRVMAVETAANGFLGAPIAGGLLALGTVWAVSAPAALGLLCVLLIGLGLRGDYRAADPNGPRELRDELSSGLLEGLRLVWRHPVLRPLAIAAGGFNFFSTGLSAVLVLYLVGEGSAVGMTAQQYSLAVLAFPVGAIGASLVAERIVARFGEVRTMVGAWGVNGPLLLLPVLLPRLWAIVVFFVLLAGVGVVGNVVTQAVRPRMVHAHQLGRVTGAGRVIAFGAMPLGALVGGQFAQWFGIPTTIVVVGVGILATAVLVGLSVTQRLVDAHEIRA
ncbi:MFS transporter [Aestuariimicrobium ganziense]|uniref:MFS transporter n=1 Tax=Aestuariimicrobium ganziense TaxID=2773677 RepID=UPI00194145C2|nr:MFS transporter [Aestuariimicrobium ganziense]